MAADDIKRFRANLRDELDGVRLYTSIAAAETDPLRRDLFLQLAQAEGVTPRCGAKLEKAGVAIEPYVPGFRARLLGRLAQRFGPRFVLPTIAVAEFSDRNKYATQSDAQAISAEERGHAAVVQEIARSAAPAAGAGRTLRVPSRGIAAPRGTTCARRCWGRTMGWYPTSA